MEQYVDYMKATIIEEIQNNTDVEMIMLIHGLLMRSASEQVKEN